MRPFWNKRTSLRSNQWLISISSKNLLRNVRWDDFKGSWTLSISNNWVSSQCSSRWLGNDLLASLATTSLNSFLFTSHQKHYLLQNKINLRRLESSSSFITISYHVHTYIHSPLIPYVRMYLTRPSAFCPFLLYFNCLTFPAFPVQLVKMRSTTWPNSYYSRPNITFLQLS